METITILCRLSDFQARPLTLFGRQHQGAIRGFVATTVIGTAIGPMVFGLAFDQLGSYNPSSWLGIVLALAAIFFSLSVKNPPNPSNCNQPLAVSGESRNDCTRGLSFTL